MKKYFMMAIAAAAITSCSQDEVMEVAEKQAINFGNTFVENVTRAIDGTYNSKTLPTSFKVYGNTQGNEDNAPVVPIFNGVDVVKGGTGVGNTYFYDTQYTQYWIADNTYNFAAVVHGTVTPNTTTGLPATIAYNATNQEDLLYAAKSNIEGQASGNSEVKFTFDHLLSKAKFTVKNTVKNNNTYYYRVKSVQINDVFTTGTYTVSLENDKPVGTWAGEDKTLDVNFGDIVTANASEKEDALEIGQAASGVSNYERLFIPAEYKGLSITCTIETLIKQGENYAVIETEDYSKSINHEFKQGLSYNFVIEKGNPGDPIKFGVETVNGWLPTSGPQNVEVK